MSKKQIKAEEVNPLMPIVVELAKSLGEWCRQVEEILLPPFKELYQFYIHYIDYQVTTA